MPCCIHVLTSCVYHGQAKERAQAAEARAAEEVTKAAGLQQELDAVAEKLASVDARCTTLQADVETKAAALESLEGVLGRIEHAVASKRSADAGQCVSCHDPA